MGKKLSKKEKYFIPNSVNEFDLIQDILFELEIDGVDYCILRNVKNVINTFPAGDVDILVDTQKDIFKKIHNKLEKLQYKLGYKIYAHSRHANVSRNFYIATKIKDKIYTINLEFFNRVFVYEYTKFKNKKYKYLKTEDVLKNKVKVKKVYSSSMPFELIHIIVDSLFNKKPKYYSWIAKNISEYLNDTSFNRMATEIIGKDARNFLNFVDWDSNEIEDKQKLYELIFKHFKRTKKISWLEDFYRDLSSLYSHFYTYFLYQGCMCLILGTDGSGKTTVCDKIGIKRERSFNKIHRIHLGNRPILLPSFRGEKIKNDSNQIIDTNNKNFHEYIVNNKKLNLYQCMRFVYISIDFILHYYFYIRPCLARGDLILTERYYTDYVIISDRYFLGVPKIIKNFCYYFIPKPDLIIYLETSKEEIIKRKQEMPLELIEHEINEFGKFIKNYKKSHIASNSGFLENAIAKVEDIIFTKGDKL